MIDNEREGVQGWRQFLASKAEMLRTVDTAREKHVGSEIQTEHGRVAEAEFRRWLESFLPKRFGVTSGYIVSQGFGDTVKLPHYDVIVYDELESPILWVNENPDQSKPGKSRALPVEYVRGVVEVKSTFDTAAAKAAMEHLNDLTPFLLGADSPTERYKRFLSLDFFCATVFFDLKISDTYNAAALDYLASMAVRGYIGGAILRGEGRHPYDSGLIQLLQGNAPHESSVGRGKQSLFDIVAGNSTQRGDDHYVAFLEWGATKFAQFAFDLIAILAGTFVRGQLSSLHGFSRPVLADKAPANSA